MKKILAMAMVALLVMTTFVGCGSNKSADNGKKMKIVTTIFPRSKTFPENLRGRMYPDEIVLLGEDSVFIPYTDPGIPLAREIKKQIDTYISEYGSVPKCIYMQNHGFVALGEIGRAHV